MGCVVQVWLPLVFVVQVVLDDGGVLLETSIHPPNISAATIARALKVLVRFKMRI